MTTGKRHDNVDPRDGRDVFSEDIPAERALQEYNAEILNAHPGVREAFLAMLVNVPEPAEDGAVRIVEAVLGAETVEELDKPWDTDGMRERLNRPLIIHSITRRPSDFADGLGVYLGCECTDPATGEKVFVTCGSVSSVAQLVRAHTLGKFPLTVVPVPAKRPTKRGYLPYHLEMDRRGQPQ